MGESLQTGRPFFLVKLLFFGYGLDVQAASWVPLGYHVLDLLVDLLQPGVDPGNLLVGLPDLMAHAVVDCLVHDLQAGLNIVDLAAHLDDLLALRDGDVYELYDQFPLGLLSCHHDPRLKKLEQQAVVGHRHDLLAVLHRAGRHEIVRQKLAGILYRRLSIIYGD